MIIWGFGRRTVKRHGAAIFQRCPNCGNSGWFQLMTVRRWFTLFFVPVVPYSRRDLLICPVCSRGVELDRARRQQALQMVAATAELRAGSIDQAGYQARIAEIGGGPSAAAAPPSLPPPPPVDTAVAPPPVEGGAPPAGSPPPV